MNKNHFKNLRHSLPGLDDQRLGILANAGITDRTHLEDVIRGMPDGGPFVARALDVAESALLGLLNWSRWPEQQGSHLMAAYPLGGVMPPTTEMLTTATTAETMSRAAIPDHASLLGRYEEARDQGARGTCTAFATVGIYEGQAGRKIDLSEAFVYSLTKQRDGHPDSEGSFLRISTAVLSDNGVCLERTLPYREDHDYLRRPPSWLAMIEARRFRSEGSPIRLAPRNVTAVREQLAQGRPVGISVPIFRSTYHSLRFHGEGRFNDRLGMFDTVAGYHAMCVGAYLDNSFLNKHDRAEEPGGGAFLVRNSWGPTWARHNPLADLLDGGPGYAILSYDYLEKHCYEAITVPAPASLTATDDASSVAAVMRSAGRSWWQRSWQAAVEPSRERLATTTRF